MNFCIIPAEPFATASGGGTSVTRSLLAELSKNGHKAFIIDYGDPNPEIDVIIQVGCTFVNLDFLPKIKEKYKNIKIISLPIYDRVQSYWKLFLFKFLYYIPVLNSYNIKKKLFKLTDHIIVHSKAELVDLVKVFNAPKDKIHLLHYGIADSFFEMSENIIKDLFISKYGIKDFVFFPAAQICKRKNQINLIKALQNTDIKIVFNNTHKIEDGLEDEFKHLVKDNSNIVCLKDLTIEELISCYKAAKVSVSLSSAETAGLVNLEAAYLGCNLVVSDLPAHREYLQDFPIAYVDPNNLEQIKTSVELAIKTRYNTEVINFIETEYRWKNYVEKLIELI